MGMDVGYGLMFGVEVYDNIADGESIRESVNVPSFSSRTGERLADRVEYKFCHKLLMNIPSLGNKGELIDGKVIDKWVWNLRDRDEDKDTGFTVSNDSLYFGYRAFEGEEPYIMPQESCMEFIDRREVAKTLFEERFPYLQGKFYLYLKVSV